MSPGGHRNGWAARLGTVLGAQTWRETIAGNPLMTCPITSAFLALVLAMAPIGSTSGSGQAESKYEEFYVQPFYRFIKFPACPVQESLQFSV